MFLPVLKMLRIGMQEHRPRRDVSPAQLIQEANMGLGKGALLWLIGIPLPIILLIAFLWH
jgi:hypothetical protein